MIQAVIAQSDMAAIGRTVCGSASENRPDDIWGLPSLLFDGYRGYYTGVKWPGRDADH
jgi:hypothetical protein